MIPVKGGCNTLGPLCGKIGFFLLHDNVCFLLHDNIHGGDCYKNFGQTNGSSICSAPVFIRFKSSKLFHVSKIEDEV